ncbi:MAG: hypothetical protein RJA63_2239 [Pseudomonadota bacterium]
MERVLKLQLALFFLSPEQRPDSYYLPLNNDMGNLFDGMPQIIPLPFEAPHEIPRVTLRSSNDKYNCNISTSRIDLIFNEQGAPESDWFDITQDFMAKSTLFVKSMFGRTKFIRFGLIGSFFVPDKNPSATIGRKYLKQDMTTAEEVNIRYNKRSESHGQLLNNIVSINTATVALPKEEKGVYIERDVNNVPSNSSLKQDDILALISKFMPSFSPDQVRGLLK